MASDDARELEQLLQRIVVAVYELNLLLRAAAMHGKQTSVDTVERTEASTDVDYPEIIVQVQDD